MRFTLTVFNTDITLSLDIGPTDDDDSLKPPLGFAGSGTGHLERSDDTMLDVTDRRRP